MAKSNQIFCVQRSFGEYWSSLSQDEPLASDGMRLPSSKQITTVKANSIHIRGATDLVPRISFYLREFEFRVVLGSCIWFLILFECPKSRIRGMDNDFSLQIYITGCNCLVRYQPLLFRPVDQCHFFQETESAIFHVNGWKSRSQQKDSSCIEKSLPTKLQLESDFSMKLLSF
jgi:hypothetical protein